MSASARIERLAPDECWKLLGQAQVGRIVLTMRALPSIRTVRFALCGDGIVVRTARSSRLYQAACSAVVAFHADHCDDGARQGWGVLVQGVAEEVADAEERSELLCQPLGTWSDTGDSFLRLVPHHVSGERVWW